MGAISNAKVLGNTSSLVIPTFAAGDGRSEGKDVFLSATAAGRSLSATR